MTENHAYIVYINSFVDYKRYFSYGEVQRAIALGELEAPPFKYTPAHPCKFCGKEIPNWNAFHPTIYCNDSCYNKASMYGKRKKRAEAKDQKELITVKLPPKQPGPVSFKYEKRIKAIVTLWNQGRSDKEISHVLGLSDRYISNLRRMFDVPPNYGKVPEIPIDPSQLKRTR